MPASETGIPCGWHQRKQARRRGTNVKEEARFYVEWIDPAARSTLAAAHSACNRPPRGISRLHRDVVTYAAQPAAVNSKGDSSPPLRSRKKVRRRLDFRVEKIYEIVEIGRNLCGASYVG